MAMVLKNNKLAAMSLGELNKNIVEKGKRMTRLATGQKIVGASDGASEFSITEKMQVQLRSLGQDIENTRTGHSMLSVGVGGIERIVEELREMKQLAINAANDTNTDDDRATIQKEFDQKKQDIADIVSSTNYNGKLLLDGTYARKHNGVTQTGESSGGGSGSGAVSPYGTRGAQGASTRPFTGAERSWPTNSQTIDGVTTVTLDEGGAYTIPPGFSGNIVVNNLAAATGVMLSQADEVLFDVIIDVEAPSSGGANLWINNLNIANSERDASVVQFHGSGNTLTLLGNSMLEFSATTEVEMEIEDEVFSDEKGMAAVIDMGDGLTVQGNGSSLQIDALQNMGACIGTDANKATGGNLKIVDANLTLNAGDGAAVGSGGLQGALGNITVENSTVNVTGGVFSGIGSGNGYSRCGDIVVTHSTINDLQNDVGGYSGLGSVDTCIGSGYYHSSCGSIKVADSVVNARNSDSALIGAGDEYSTCQDITITNSDVIGYSFHGAGVGAGRRGTAGNVYIKNATKIQHESSNGAAVGSGLNGHVGMIYLSPSSLELLDASRAYQATDHVIPGIGHGRNGSAGDVSGVADIEDDEPAEPQNPQEVPGELVEYDFEGTPLIIHTGTRANQHMRCYIEDLGLNALGIANAELTTQEKATKLLGNPRDPREVGILDKAINYALNEATQVGAYMSRLEQTQENLTNNQENTTAAESTIRDADMAAEMTAMAKANILTQSSQAMLAQANQISSNVLDLLG